jgi:hypothetical protein
MQIEQKRETRETQAIQEKKKGADVLTPDKTPSYGFGLTLAAVFLLGNLFVAAIYFHVINP